jgi:hypothetical protein
MDDRALGEMVKADILTQSQAEFVKAADIAAEWALRLWQALSKKNWLDLARVTPYMPSCIRHWWREWIALYDTSKDYPLHGRKYKGEGRDPKWSMREGLIKNMVVTPHLIASLISRGLLICPCERQPDTLMKYIEGDGNGWEDVNELHHNMRNALWESGQDDAASCV